MDITSKLAQYKRWIATHFSSKTVRKTGINPQQLQIEKNARRVTIIDNIIHLYITTYGAQLNKMVKPINSYQTYD
jgi:hypothetical protein